MASILDGIPISFYGIQRSTTKSVEGCTKREKAGEIKRQERDGGGGGENGEKYARSTRFVMNL